MLKTESGQEGWVTGWDGYDHFDSKFHLVQKLAGVPNLHYTFRFYAEDPRKLHPDWKGPVWKLIEDGQVAIGMTEEMAKMACGRDIRTAGFVLTGGEARQFTYVITRSSSLKKERYQSTWNDRGARSVCWSSKR